MSEISSQSKLRIAPIAVAASLSAVGMGLVSDGVAMADSVTDTIDVTVSTSCTFNSISSKTYAGSAANGAEVNNFTDAGVHEFNLFCNDNSGFVVSATPHNLTATGLQDVVAYTDNYTPSGTSSLWTANVTSETTGLTVVPVVPAAGGTIISSNTHTAASGASFAATYEAYIGSETPAGTYTGTIVYTLSPSGSVNSGSNSGSQGGDIGSNTGIDNENTNPDSNQGENINNPDSSNSGSSNSGANTNNTQNTPSLMTSPTYNTYNVTNYPGGASVASTLGGSTVGSSTNEANTSSTADGDDSDAGDSYEKPLGVTNTKTSSDKTSGEMDPAPIIAAGVLAASGIAAIVVAKNRDKEEDKN